MDYTRNFKGFSVRNLELGPVKKTPSYQGELRRAGDNRLVCRFSQAGDGDPTSVDWAPGTEDDRKVLARLGIETANEKSHADDGEIFSWAVVEASPVLLERFSEYGIEVVCDDHRFDMQCRENADSVIYARTDQDNVVQVPGIYRPSERRLWREKINRHLGDREDVLEIINDRYVKSSQ
jgi:hypothetical protein